MTTMPLTDWLNLIACVGHLGVAVLVWLRGARNPLRLLLVFLCLDFFAWNLAHFFYRVSEDATWHWLDMALSPFGPPLSLHIVSVFVGRSKNQQGMITAAYGAFALLSLWAALGFWGEDVFLWVGSGLAWSHTFLVFLAPTTVATIVLLIRHLSRATTASEKLSTRLLVIAVVVGTVLGATEVWEEAFPVAGLGHLGSLGATVLIAFVGLRYGALFRAKTDLFGVYALTVGIVGVLGYLSLFFALGSHVAFSFFGITLLTIALGVVTRDFAMTWALSRERERYLTTLGRFSLQLAHDIKNPLAALQGALQFLEEERAQGRSIDTQHAFIELSLEQVRRIDAMIGKYQRLGHLTPVAVPIEINALASQSLASVRLGHEAPSISYELELFSALPACRADPDLIGVALQNVFVNALHAMRARGGRLTLRTGLLSEEWLYVEVVDTGIGMDARQLAQAFDDFFTTKPSGSGLGLGFARRAIEAHGGRVRLFSQQERGTTVRFELPFSPQVGVGAKTA